MGMVWFSTGSVVWAMSSSSCVDQTRQVGLDETVAWACAELLSD
jgi:hypothetical protein